ncbi:hypothetical protein OUZ56_019753 [Daphnia magna]|uniref:Uncharacterized protein n=1 Tax=Daphnia magna TaxID=35525 RepID=A0ABQ9ZCI1_9CRUS|nr:hypothetical protein OUZ56_019753 [Daphnia magna]
MATDSGTQRELLFIQASVSILRVDCSSIGVPLIRPKTEQKSGSLRFMERRSKSANVLNRFLPRVRLLAFTVDIDGAFLVTMTTTRCES